MGVRQIRHLHLCASINVVYEVSTAWSTFCTRTAVFISYLDSFTCEFFSYIHFTVVNLDVGPNLNPGWTF